ncbi:zf-HC2 domain-containing protein [Streptomyces sp. NPDC048560]|uniref:zf-HC2 domain-containing protein n=1 Tax=Streptomyces sp. NPDC048560 TaxID=3155488 RepID=UPI00342EC64D
MHSPELRRASGAYALGVLGAAGAFRFEEHLAECPACRCQVHEFRAVAALIAEHGRPTAEDVEPVREPGPGLLHRTVAAVAALRRRARWRRAALVTAAAVLAVGGPWMAGGPPDAPAQARAERWGGRDPASGVVAAVTTGAREWGTDVDLRVERVPVAGVCALVAVARDGSEQTVSTWSAGRAGGEPVHVSGGAAIDPGAIDRFEVRTEHGQRLVTLTR